MRIVNYAHLDTTHVQPQFEKVKAALAAGDFRSADLKKLRGRPYYRVKLDDTNRLLLQFYAHQGETICLLLEVIPFHRYEKSRFLRGAAIQEHLIEEDAAPPASPAPLAFLNPDSSVIHVLDKPVSFDAAQEQVYHTPLPLLLVGAAGSGKTALTLEKLRVLPGKVLYVTKNRHLAAQAADLYARSGPVDDMQRCDFLALQDLMDTTHVASGRPATYATFLSWFNRQPELRKAFSAQGLYEEFQGVLTAQPAGPLTLDAYLKLGVRQSLFPVERRPDVYAWHARWASRLSAEGLYDPNVEAQRRLQLLPRAYDAVVVDEVQDMTPVQLTLALSALKPEAAQQFMLCGDTNQVVHPNFFSWAAVRDVTRQSAQGTPIHALHSNFRSAAEITRVSNRVLEIKHARFGHLDREGSVLATAMTAVPGQVEILPGDAGTVRRLDNAIRASARYAVIVLREEDKAAAREAYGTPLIFSVEEAKGLEYEGVVLHNLISSDRAAYEEIGAGVSADDLGDVTYGRARDKADTSAQQYKFHLNALYVALTRATRHVLMVEQDQTHPMLTLLQAVPGDGAAVQVAASSAAEWTAQAQQLRSLGRTEQAEAIEQTVAKIKPVPWDVLDAAAVRTLRNTPFRNLKPQGVKAILDEAVFHQQFHVLDYLADYEYGPAHTLMSGGGTRFQARDKLVIQQAGNYLKKGTKWVHFDCDVYGPDYRTKFNVTPLMMAVLSGNSGVIPELLARGADPEQRDHYGQTAAMYAIQEAAMNPAQTDRELTALTDLLAPRFLDVQVQGQFHRLKQGQGEYTALYRMLALIKMLHWIHEDEVPGIDADLLSLLPAASEGLRKADVEEFQRVLAGAEVESPEPSQPPLFVEVESGFYMPNPSLHLRVGETWAPLADVMAFDLLSLPAGYGQLSKRQVILSLPRERPPHVPLPRTVAPATGTSLAGAALDYDMNLADLLALVELTGQADPVDTVSIMQLNSRHIRFTLERLRQARLVIEDDHAQLSALVDEGRYIRSSGRLRGLSDEALRLLLAWQAWRQPQELSVAALTELRLAHLGRVADELERGVGPMPAELDRRSSEVPKQVFVAGQVRAVASVLQKAKDQDCALVVTFGPDGGFFQFNFQDDQLWGEVGADSTERFDWPVLLEWNLAPSVDDPVHRRIFPASVDLEDAVWEVANVASRLLSYDGGEIDVELVD